MATQRQSMSTPITSSEAVTPHLARSRPDPQPKSSTRINHAFRLSRDFRLLMTDGAILYKSSPCLASPTSGSGDVSGYLPLRYGSRGYSCGQRTEPETGDS